MRHSLLDRPRTLAAFSAALLVLGCTTLQERAQQIQYTQPSGVTLLGESEIRRDIVGSTLSGTSRKGPTYAEFYQPDGTIRGLWDGDEPYRGTWAVSGPVWCARYPNTSGCYLFSRDGDEVTWHETDGTTLPPPALLLPGNAHSL